MTLETTSNEATTTSTATTEVNENNQTEVNTKVQEQVDTKPSVDVSKLGKGDSKESKGEAQKESEDQSVETASDDANTEQDSAKEEIVYELKNTEDSALSEQHVKGLEEFAKQNGLSNEAAQAILDRENSLVQSLLQAQAQHAEAQAKEWAEQVQQDKFLGGEKFKETSFYANKALTTFGSEGLTELLEKTGYGNNPEVVKFFAKVGKLAAPDTYEKQGGMPVEKKSMADRWYGETSGKHS